MEDNKGNPDDSAYGSTDTSNSQKSRSSSKSHQSSRSSSSGYDQPSTSDSSYNASGIPSKEHKAKKGKDSKSSVANACNANRTEDLSTCTNNALLSNIVNISNSSNTTTTTNNNNNVKNANVACSMTVNKGINSGDVTEVEPITNKKNITEQMSPVKTPEVNQLTYGVTQMMRNGIQGKSRNLQKAQEDELLGSTFNENGIFRNVRSDHLKEQSQQTVQDGFVAAISLHDGVVLHVTTSMYKILGYTKDMWLGRSLIDFVYPKDRIVFTTHVTMELNLPFMGCDNNALRGDCSPSSFYCRFRVYSDRKNSNGFTTTEKKDSYKSFHVSTKVTDVKGDSFTNEMVNNNGGSLNGAYIVAIAKTVKSAYQSPEEIPLMRTFSTRHSASCHFNHMDTSAIPYLGYLPQDILGNSVFDYYHPEDMPHLQEVYHQVLREEGNLFRSKPYRFRARSGSYALLETEWSCFINPWTRKLEFIIGQHRVLRGPKNPDVFGESNEISSIPEEVLKESKNIQLEIKRSLRETVKRALSDGNKENRKRRKELAKYVGNLIEEMVQNMEMDTYDKAFKEGESFSEQGSVVMGHISPHHQGTPSEPSSETLPSYHHCNYNDNIQRYFDSRPKTHSTDESAESKEAVTPPVIDEEGKFTPLLDSGSGDDTGCEQNVTRIQSEGEGSPLQDSSGSCAESVGHPYVRVTLTEEILLRHNAITEKFFIQQNRETKGTAHQHLKALEATEALLTGMASSTANAAAAVGLTSKSNIVTSNTAVTTIPVLLSPTGLHKESCQRLKRCGSHSPDRETHKCCKHSHMKPPLLSAEKFNSTPANNNNLWSSFTSLSNSGYPSTNYSVAHPDSVMSTRPSGASLPVSARSSNPFRPSQNMALPAYAVVPATTQSTTGRSLNESHMATHVLMPLQYFSTVPESAANHSITSMIHPNTVTHVVIPNVALYHPPINPLQQQCTIETMRLTSSEPTKNAHISKMKTPINHHYDYPPPPPPKIACQIFGQSGINSASTKLHLNNQHRHHHHHHHLQQQTHHRQANEVLPILNNPQSSLGNLKQPVVSTTEVSPEVLLTDSDSADADLQDDLTGSSLNSFLKSDDVCEDSLKTDSRNACGSPSDKDIESMNWEHSIENSGHLEKPKPILNVKKPHWLLDVNMTPDIIYEYQIKQRDMAKILQEDSQFLSKTHQPDLVNDQLCQLYVELAESSKGTTGTDNRNGDSASGLTLTCEDAAVLDDSADEFLEKDLEDDPLNLLVEDV